VVDGFVDALGDTLTWGLDWMMQLRSGGLFLATHGFTTDASQTLTEIEKTTVKFGGETKVVSLCRSYLQVGDDLWQVPQSRRV
jgi:hypothetical protein